jgi:RNA polymerase sigma-70 factor (ECF subfamily)
MKATAMSRRDAPDFDGLYERLAPRVLALAFQVTGDRTLAEDVMQDTFLAVHRSLHRFRGEADPATWVYRIALNAGRKARARRERSSRRDRDARRAPPDPAHAWTGDGDTAALYRALDRLSPAHREVISLMSLRELSAGTIAEILGVPPGTVHSRAHHARAALREALSDDESAPPRPVLQR